MRALTIRERIDVLVHARKIWSTSFKWTTSALARTKNGIAVEPDHPSATSFCARGVVLKSLVDLKLQESWADFSDREHQVSAEVARTVGLSGKTNCELANNIVRWNNTSDFKTVAEGFKRTIARLQKRLK